MSNWLSHINSFIYEFVYFSQVSAGFEEVSSVYWLKLHPLQTLVRFFLLFVFLHKVVIYVLAPGRFNFQSKSFGDR